MWQCVAAGCWHPRESFLPDVRLRATSELKTQNKINYPAARCSCGTGGLGICWMGWHHHQWLLRLSGKFYLDICCYGFDAVFLKIPDSTFLLPPAQDWVHFPPFLHAGLSGSFVSVPSDSFFQAHALVWPWLLKGATPPLLMWYSRDPLFCPFIFYCLFSVC